MSRYLCVVDLESAGLWNDSVIFSMGLTFGEYKIGAGDFHHLLDTSLYVKFNAKDQHLNLNRHFDTDTMRWWSEQSVEAKKAIKPSPDDVLLEELPNILDEYFKNKPIRLKDCDIWDRRSFDVFKLEHIYKETLNKTSVPWNAANELEVSTFLKFQGFDRYGDIQGSSIPTFIHHRADHDAALDHHRIINALTLNGLLTNDEE